MKKVLLVNDSKFESRIMKDMLVSIGYEVKISDEYQAVEHALTELPEFVISNYTMKEICGDQLISQIKEKNPLQKCILSSSSPINTRALGAGKIDFVFQTPISESRLEEIFTMLSADQVTSQTEAQGKSCLFCGNQLRGDTQSAFKFCPNCGHQF